MATQPCTIPSWTALPGCWERFQGALARRVRECNALSERLLWLLSRSGAPLDCVTVESVVRPGDRIECSFDAALGTLTCVPGPAVRAAARHFRWSGATFLSDGREFSIEQTADIVLDELVCTDDE